MKSFHLNEVLKTARLEKGLTQNQVAKIAKISQSKYSKFEAGKQKIDADSFLNLAWELEIDWDWYE